MRKIEDKEMVGLTCWEVFHQANQGICIFDCKLENMYANEKAKNVLRTLDPELCKKFTGVCLRFIAMVEAKKARLINYSDRLMHRQAVINVSCFSFNTEEQVFIMIAFDYDPGGESGGPNETALTPREKDILQAIADGKTNKEISEMLGIGFETVKSHVRNLLAKTGASSRTELIGKHGRLL